MGIFFGVKERQSNCAKAGSVFRGEQGVIDLASIMVGIIVIGMIGGTIAATVFAVIPWAQDNAAKHQLVSLHSAQNAYYGLSAAPGAVLPAGFPSNSYFDSEGLESAGLMLQGDNYCTVALPGGQEYKAYSRSASGNIFVSTNNNKTAQLLATGEDIAEPCDFLFITPDGNTQTSVDTDGDGILNTGDEDIDGDGIPNTADDDIDGDNIPNAVDEDIDGDGTPNAEDSSPNGEGSAEYIDPTPTKTILTYQCSSDEHGHLPMRGSVVGSETWSDGVTKTYNSSNVTEMGERTLLAGIAYTVTFEGTYTIFGESDSNDLTESCLRSVQHWGSASGVTDASYAFNDAGQLTDLPQHIPSTITKMRFMFDDASKINDPDISKWNVTNVTDMTGMFLDSEAFNQPLNDWKVSNVTNMSQMFMNNRRFNQPLNDWNVSKVTNMSQMFDDAESFNKPLDKWDTANVTDMSSMFRATEVFNQPLNNWNTANVSNMSSMFYESDIFNGNITNWNTSRVTNMNGMFFEAKRFNQNLTSWNVSQVTNMNSMFLQAEQFNQNLSGWNTSSLVDGGMFASIAFNSTYLPPNTTK